MRKSSIALLPALAAVGLASFGVYQHQQLIDHAVPTSTIPWSDITVPVTASIPVPIQYTNEPDTPPVTPPYEYPSSSTKAPKAPKAAKTKTAKVAKVTPKTRSSSPVVKDNPNIGKAGNLGG